jgi:enoyl-[acyl-carrier protein] reductase II
MTETFGVSRPVMNAGMGHVAVPELVAAVSEAGGLGILGSSTSTPAEVGDAVRAVRRRTARPFGANVTLAFPNALDIATVLLEARIDVLWLSMGVSAELVDAVHERGGRAMYSIATRRHARRAAADGVDAIVATGHEAAAHGSAVTSVVLVPLVAREVDVPIIASGGFADGAGLAAALALGAAGVSMGTRFALSAESPVHAATRQALLDADEAGTVVSDRVDGIPSRFLATAATATLEAGAALPEPVGVAHRGGDTAAALLEGELSRGVVASGQVVGAIDRVESCREIVERTVADAEAILTRLAEDD